MMTRRDFELIADTLHEIYTEPGSDSERIWIQITHTLTDAFEQTYLNFNRTRFELVVYAVQ